MSTSTRRHNMWRVVIVLQILLLAAGTSADRGVQVTIDERLRPGSAVRDLRTLVMPLGALQFTYELVQSPRFAYKYFAIENTSVLVTKTEILRDVLVREQFCSVDECRLLLQVNATGRPFVTEMAAAAAAGRRQNGVMNEGVYQLLNLEVTVNSVIDQPCKFDKAITTQDVNELSDGQTFINLGNLNCPRLPSSVYLRLTLVDAVGNIVPQNRSGGFRLRHVLIKSKPQSLFRVDLIAPAGLDREACEWHNFTVIAAIGDRETSARVFIHVDDADDNEPVFQHSSYSLVIREDAPLGEILKMEASDADSLPQNTEFAYTIIEVKCRQAVRGRNAHAAATEAATRETDGECSKDTFGLNPRSGALSLLKPLDYEEAARWTLTCGLRVFGALVNSTTTVNIDVQNVNEAPTISGCADSNANTSHYSVPENAREPVTLCVVRARDEDGDTPKCELSYDPYARQKFEARRYFQLALSKQADGVSEWNLTTTSFPFDFEDESLHRIMILCTDYISDGRPQMTASSLVLVAVENRNDPPKFARSSYTYELLENDELSAGDRQRKRGSVMRTIIPNIAYSVDPAFANASDVQLSILQSSADKQIEKAFEIRGRDLCVNDSFVFDREAREWYNFSLLARLNSDPSMASTVPVTIEIVDRNDNSPVFHTADNNLTIEVRTDAQVGRQVYCCVLAVDRDAGANGRVQYFISGAASGNDDARLDAAEYFTIDANTGEVFLNRPLNGSLVGQVLQLRIEARDQPTAGDARTASMLLRMQVIRPQQFFGGSRDATLFVFGEYHNVVVIIMIVGVTVLISGFLLGLIVCIKSKNSERRARRQSPHFAAGINGHPFIKSTGLKVKVQTAGGYSRFRQTSPSHYYNVATYAPNTATEIDYPEASIMQQAQQSEEIGDALHAYDGQSNGNLSLPLQFPASTLGKLPIGLNLTAPPTQLAVESLSSSSTNSPKGTVMRSFATDAPMSNAGNGLPPLSMDLESNTTDIDSGQGSSTSTSKMADFSVGHQRRSSAETAITDGSEMVTYDRDRQMPLPISLPHPLQTHDIYCTCSRKHGAANASRTSTPSPLPQPHSHSHSHSHRRNLPQTLAQDSCSPVVIKSILRNNTNNNNNTLGVHQHYHTMLPRKHAHGTQNAVAVAVHGGDQQRSLLSSSEV